MKKVLTPALLALCVAGLCYGSFWFGGRYGGTSEGPTVVSLEKMGHLVSFRIHMSTHVLQDGKVLYMANGDALIASDIRGAKLLERDEKNRYARIQLPTPSYLALAWMQITRGWSGRRSG